MSKRLKISVVKEDTFQLLRNWASTVCKQPMFTQRNKKRKFNKEETCSQYHCLVHNDDRTICEIYECDGKYPNLNPNKIPEYIS